MKRLLSYALTFVFVISALVMITNIPAKAANGDGYLEWGGIAASSFAGGNGTEGSPFIIETAAQLEYMRKLIEKGSYSTSYFKLGNDIYYNDVSNADSWDTNTAPKYKWKPMGEDGALFSGGFDGDGYTIYGLYCNVESGNGVGFIGKSKFGTIKNLTIDKSYIRGASGVGAIVGRANDAVDIINCTNYATVVSVRNAVGGILGGSDSRNTEGNGVTIKYCKNYGKIVSEATMDASAGGIVGYSHSGDIRMEIVGCENYGEVSSSSGSYIGGIIGAVSTEEDGLNPIVACKNYGKISGLYNIGGIAGSGIATEILMCVNYGEIVGTMYVGGISGYCTSKVGTVLAPYERNVNMGTVKGDDCVGGIVGYARYVAIAECANLGTALASSNAGGIVGKLGATAGEKGACRVSNCYNSGTVEGDTNVAAIVGFVNSNATADGGKIIPTVEYCVNTGSLPIGVTAIANGSVDFTTTFNASKSINSEYVDDNDFAAAGFDADLWSATKTNPILVNVPLKCQNAIDDELFAAPVATVRYNRADRPVGLKVSTTIKNNSDGITYGTVMIPTDLIYVDLTVDTVDAINVPAVWMSSENTFNAVLTDIPLNNYLTSLSVRAYAKIPEGDGYVYVYSDVVEFNYSQAAESMKDSAAAVVAIKDAVFVSASDISVMIGNSSKLAVDVRSLGKVTLKYTSSDTSVATVSPEGYVRALKEGTADITITVTSGSVTESVIVKASAYVPYDGEIVIVNNLAKQDDNFRIICNDIPFQYNTISKNDGFMFVYNGVVIIEDAGNHTTDMIESILEVREEYIRGAGLGDAEVASEDYKLELIIILSHHHGDHHGSLMDYIFKSPYVTITESYTPVRQASDRNEVVKYYNNISAHSPNVKITQVNYGEVINLSYAGGEITVDLMGAVLNWKDFISNSTEWQNCNSIWTRVTCNGRSFLMTGDTYAEEANVGREYNDAMEGMCMTYSDYNGVNYLEADFVKPAHHGRLVSTKPLFTISEPEFIIVSGWFGLDDGGSTASGVKYGDVYYMGDSRLVFHVDTNGNVTVVEGRARCFQNDVGVLYVDPNYYYDLIK